MNYERFRSSDYRFLAICLLLLAGCAWYSVRNFHRAFPEASIDFRVDRQGGRQIASGFLAARGYHLDGYRDASSFTYDDGAKTFLEREAGLEKANQIMGSRVRLWTWAYRWFRPQQKEEFRAQVTPRGELVGFAHELPEDAARPDISAADARLLAENFLRAVMRRDPASLEFVETSDTARPHRVDRVFTWKERGFSLRDATYRIEVRLLGNEIGAYREYLKVPEQWTRDYQRLRSKNEVASMVDTAFMAVLVVGLVIVIVMRVRRQDVRWRRAAVIGIIAMALQFLASLNQFSLEEFQYPTTDSYPSFIARLLIQALVGALAAGGLLFVLAAGAEPVYREAFRDKVSIGNLFRLRGLRTRRFFLGAVLGITLTAIFVAYQTVFYIVASRHGAWSPADVPYDDLLNTRFPWLFVLIGGYLPAVSEEFLFRMFAIPFLRRLARSMVAAVILAGFIWGFGHAAYPQQPFYIRGVEVGIGGVALGLVMLRWGILPTLVWHYSVDAMYSAMLLMRSHSLYYKLSGAAATGVIVLPVVVALIGYWRRGGFAPETGLLNGDEAAAEEPRPEPAPAESAPARGYAPLGARARIAAVAIFAAGLLALIIPVSRFGASPRYAITAGQARAAADAFLRGRGLDPGAFRHVTFPETHWGGDDRLAAKYFLDRQPISYAARMFEQYRPVRFWATRYFKSLDREEIAVAVHPETGKVMTFVHTIPEARAGADIPADAARAIAADFAASQGWDLSRMELKESSSEMKKARRDHTFEWEALPGDPRNLGEVKYRLRVVVSGDRATMLRAWWKIPEAYSRARSQQNFTSIAALVMRIVVIAAGAVFGILLLIGTIRKGSVRWRVAMRLGALLTALMAVGPLLGLKLVMQNYNTAVPVETFEAMTYMGVAIVVIFGFVMMAAAVALITSHYPDSLDALRAAGRRVMGWDALAALLAAAGLWMIQRQLAAALMDRFHAQALFSIGGSELVAIPAPALAALAGAAQSAVLMASALAVIALVLARFPKRWMVWPAAVIALFATLSGDIRTPGEFALQYGVSLAGAAAAVAFCVWFARRNYLAYAIVLPAFALRGPLAELFGNPIGSLRVQGWIVAAVALAGLAWAVLPALAKKRAAAGAGA